MGDRGTENGYVTEVPSSLKQLARLVVRGFYSIEDALIIDMLVRNPCMKEDDIADLLKFERKMLRSKIATLKNDKFLQVKLKIETGPDGKSQKVNYYFINYQSFVNVVKYKLDHMRKRMEMEERDATSRASFRCPNCQKTFTDLEADQLFDPMTGNFHCTMCNSMVEDDPSALPKKDARHLLARFNEQLEPLYILLREVEDVKLAPSLLEPEPADISHLQRDAEGRVKAVGAQKAPGETWSGEATRKHGFLTEETRVDITIGDEGATKKEEVRKERPVWMIESTVLTESQQASSSSLVEDASLQQAASSSQATAKSKDDIMSVLLAHEKRESSKKMFKVGDDSSDDEIIETVPAVAAQPASYVEEVTVLDSDDEDEDQVPMITVGDSKYPLTDVIGNEELIAKMTPAEKDAYIQIYQDYYAHMYD